MLHIIDLYYRLPHFLNCRCVSYPSILFIEGIYRPFPVWIISDSAPVSLGALQVHYIVHKTFPILSCSIFRLCDPKTRSQMLKVKGKYTVSRLYKDVFFSSFLPWENCFLFVLGSMRLLSYCLFLVSHSLRWHCSPTELYFHYLTVSKQLLLIHIPGNLLWRCVVKL